MMITKLFYFDLSRKICQKTLKSKNFKQKLRHQEALVEVEAIQKLLLPHPRSEHVRNVTQ